MKNKQKSSFSAYPPPPSYPTSSSSSSFATFSSPTASYVFPSPFTEVDVPAALHGKGVNLRYLGTVFEYLCDNPIRRNFLRDETTFIPGMVLCAVEAVARARAIKNFVNKHLRIQMKSLALSVEAPYRIMLVNEFNVFFRYDDDPLKRDETEQNWREIREDLLYNHGFVEEKVDICLAMVRGVFHPSKGGIGEGVTAVIRGVSYSPSDVQDFLIQADSELGATPLYLLFSRLVKIMNLEFSDVAVRQFLNFSPMLKVIGGSFPAEASTPFHLADLSRIGVILKGMEIGMAAQANFFYSQGLVVEARAGGKDAANHHYALAESVYKKIISAHPNDFETKYNLGVTKYRMLLLKYPPSEDMIFDSKDPEVQAMSLDLNDLKAAGPTDPRVRTLMGKFYLSCGKYQKAEIYLLKAVVLAPESEEYLRNYADLLEGSQLCMLAGIFRLRASLVKKIIKKSRERILKEHWHTEGTNDNVLSQLMNGDSMVEDQQDLFLSQSIDIMSSYPPQIQDIVVGKRRCDKATVIKTVTEFIQNNAPPPSPEPTTASPAPRKKKKFW
eukprot:CAMPEP_0201543216 /NCGR_PEP_ID=MMETSP0161_2-20130828/72473_1 /ASSEMBLY_ACC=CAM_ASM_000251 /TAXON_ID=180227 /ORGANISM="Neoparamoeba aestuarina, Strain SoJaBio B1-5/56/2" /LENGTH=554 /DNA_ID=CAMNT_0047950969 /DNA_START=42 /DNA_END=1703 /DNA_ORIENTATION=-